MSYYNKHIVLGKIDEIANKLFIIKDKLNSFGYSDGTLGLSLFFKFYSIHTEEEEYNKISLELLEKTFCQIKKRRLIDNCFFNQLSETGIFLEFFKQKAEVYIDVNNILAPIDRILYKNMLDHLNDKNYDPYTGALSAGIYFLNRLNSSEFVIPYLEKLIIGIHKMALKDNNGGYFWTSKLFNDDRVYLGLSHGSAGIILFLCQAYRNNILKDECQAIIRKSVKYTMNHKLDGINEFPDIVGQESVQTRLCLAYGDLGIAYALLLSSEVLNDLTLKDSAIKVFQRAIQRKTKENTLIGDASLRYGAAGVAAIYNKVYDITQMNDFEKTAQYWYQQIPSYSKSNDNFAGFRSVFNQSSFSTNFSFMEGISGIGASLMKSIDLNDRISFDGLLWLY